MEGVTEIATDSPISLNAGRHVVVRELQHMSKRIIYLFGSIYRPLVAHSTDMLSMDQ